MLRIAQQQRALAVPAANQKLEPEGARLDRDQRIGAIGVTQGGHFAGPFAEVEAQALPKAHDAGIADSRMVIARRQRLRHTRVHRQGDSLALSSSSGSFLTYPLPGQSQRWDAEVLGDGKWLTALANSLFIGSAVTLPAIVSAIAAGAPFAFAASFDDVVIAPLISGAEQRTLPREVFSGLHDSITLTAVATIMIVFSTAPKAPARGQALQAA